MFGLLSCVNQVSLVSACAKFQPPSMSRSSWIVCGWVVWWGGLVVITVSNLNPSCIELELGLGFDNCLQNNTCQRAWPIIHRIAWHHRPSWWWRLHGSAWPSSSSPPPPSHLQSTGRSRPCYHDHHIHLNTKCYPLSHPPCHTNQSCTTHHPGWHHSYQPYSWVGC